MFQLNKHLTKPGHPWSKFGSGNIESLSKAAKELKAKGLLKSGANGLNGSASNSVSNSLAATPTGSRAASPAPSSTSSFNDLDGDGGAVGREVRRRLVEWWSKEYSANRMRLCVIGKGESALFCLLQHVISMILRIESLDELSEMVSTLFSPIQRGPVDPLPLIADHPFGENEKGVSVIVDYCGIYSHVCVQTLVRAETIMGFHAIEISFPLAYQAPLWRHQPANFIAHFIGHEGPGSVYSYLKQKGWVTALSSGAQPLARGFAMFRVTVQLTKEGFGERY